MRVKSRRHTAKVEIIRNMACTTVRLLVLSPAAKGRNEAGWSRCGGNDRAVDHAWCIQVFGETRQRLEERRETGLLLDSKDYTRRYIKRL